MGNWWDYAPPRVNQAWPEASREMPVTAQKAREFARDGVNGGRG